MKTNSIFILLLCLAFSFHLKAQDTIVKVNGELIPAKITEVGMSTITYKKANFEDGPAFVINKSDILQVRYRNGRREEFAAAVNSATAAIGSQTMATAASTVNPMNQNKPEGPVTSGQNPQQQKPVKGMISDKYKIETDGKKFFVNGQKIGQKDVDRLLSRSQNPAVVMAAKTAKITKIFQKITKITSYPSTVSGGIACVSTFRTVFIEFQNGGARASSWVNAGLSFVGTLTFPITAKLLKKQRTKLYDKAIDLYNIGKQ